ncbi:MAG: class I tRNA ligase family protein, partial [Rhodospirillales bacterium]|nr:class I tRNA ligase family protein [Rhodospirillales bacterium]
FDIHGGGQDLIFPHHENEIAQSTCAHGGTPFVRYWMHNGYLMVEGEKMSKSLGNFFTVRELLAEHPGEALRLTMLQTHYRQPLNWTADGVRQAKETLDRCYASLRNVSDIEPVPSDPPQSLLDALSDDLNTPLAISHVHEVVGALNKAADASEKAELKGQLLAGGDLLGLLRQDPEVWFKWQPDATASGLDDAAIDALIVERSEARKAKDFNRADEIRDQLKESGILLEDGAGGTTWRRG